MKKLTILIISSMLLLGVSARQSLAEEVLPEGKDYPATIYDGKTVVSVDRTDEFTNAYRTRLKQALLNDTVFAGEYALAEWGCGSSGCHVIAFINKRTGRALSRSFQAFEGGTLEEPVSIGEDIVYMDKNSRLLVTAETTEDGVESSNYYVLNNNKLELIRKVVAKK